MSTLLRDSIFGQICRLFYPFGFLRYVDELPKLPLASPIVTNIQPETHHGDICSPQTSNDEFNNSDWKSFGFCKKEVDITLIEEKIVRSSASSILSDRDEVCAGVGWTSETDPDCPYNWRSGKKAFVAFQICLYTFAVYIASAIFLASLPAVMQKYNVSTTASSLVIALYVLGYGLGAMIFSPISEFASVGRNIPYITTFAFFIVASVAAATSQSFAALLVWRFVQGFMGSPALATGGASLQDMYRNEVLPFAFSGWVFAATCGPALGPVISCFSVPAENWRWSLWEVVWLSGFVFIILLCLLPETSSDKILYDRRRRLQRRSTDDSLLQRDPEVLALGTILHRVLIRPTLIMLTNPAVFFANIYTMLMYGIYYSFFDSFPRVYLYTYRFREGDLGLAFLSITVGALLGLALYLPWAYWWSRNMQKLGLRQAEKCLVPGIFGSVLIPIGLFLFAWTSRAEIHWAVGLSGVVLETAGVFVVLQCLSNYLILAYPKDAASLFAGNDFLRSCLAAGAVVFSHPLYAHLGVAKGVSILAACTVLCVGGMVALFLGGHRLRAAPLG